MFKPKLDVKFSLFKCYTLGVFLWESKFLGFQPSFRQVAVVACSSICISRKIIKLLPFFLFSTLNRVVGCDVSYGRIPLVTLMFPKVVTWLHLFLMFFIFINHFPNGLLDSFPRNKFNVMNAFPMDSFHCFS